MSAEDPSLVPRPSEGGGGRPGDEAKRIHVTEIPMLFACCVSTTKKIVHNGRFSVGKGRQQLRAL